MYMQTDNNNTIHGEGNLDSWKNAVLLYQQNTTTHTHTKMAPVEGSNMQWVGEEPMQGRL